MNEVRELLKNTKILGLGFDALRKETPKAVRQMIKETFENINEAISLLKPEPTGEEIRALIEKYGDPQYKTNAFALYDLISIAQQLQTKLTSAKRMHSNALDAIAKLKGEIKGLRDDVKEFNTGWEAAQKGKPFDDEQTDIWQQGWQIFGYDKVKKEIEGLRETALQVIEIKTWCRQLNVKYNNYKTALDERIDALAQALKGGE